MRLMLDLSLRRLEPELMDQPELAEHEHHQALAGLARINRLSRSAGILWPELRRLALAQPSQPLRVLDIASGAGDVPIALWHKARRAGLKLNILGIDRSAVAVEHARSAAAKAAADVDFRTHDALAEPLPSGFDVAMSSLFLHHLSRADAVLLLERMAAAAHRAVLVNDLQRSRAGYLAAQAACRVVTRSTIVRVDGPQSVAAAFTIAEVQQMAAQARIASARVERRWPFRFLLAWQRS